MEKTPRTIPIGAATITLMNAGTLQVNLASWLTRPPAERPALYAGEFNQPIQVPVLCVHIALPGSSILVDACDPQSLVHSDYAPPGYQPPPDLITQLAQVGVQPEEIDHLIITHAHFDHYNGIAAEGRLCFPNARHYLGQADWEQVQTALQQPDSVPTQTLGLAQREGRLELVGQPLDLAEGVRIIPAPGETAGHQLVRIQSEGQTLYCLGDLYHHPLEVDYPEWHVHWAEAETTRQSRQALMEAALAEKALLIATHIGTPGYLQQSDSRIIWRPAS